MARPDRVRLLRDGPTGVEAIRARFSGHAYDPHRHDEWLVGVTDEGVQEFRCRGARRRSTPGRVILIEPGEAHDGQAGDAGGFAYRMLYLPQRWLRGGLGGAAGDPGFRATLNDDAPLAAAIRRAWEVLALASERLLRDAALDAVLDALRPHLGRAGPAAARDPIVARRARELLQDAIAADHGADALARAAGAEDRFRLARAFRAAYGTSPHAFLVQARLVRARALLAAGGRRPARGGRGRLRLRRPEPSRPLVPPRLPHDAGRLPRALHGRSRQEREPPPHPPRLTRRGRRGMTFDTKVAVLVLDDLAVWQKLNVTAFLATGIAAAAPEALGEPYEDAAGRLHARLLGQPILVFAADPPGLLRAWGFAIEAGLTRATYVRAMFATGHDAANRAAFRAEPAGAPDLVGLALRGPRKAVDKATRGLALHG